MISVTLTSSRNIQIVRINQDWVNNMGQLQVEAIAAQVHCQWIILLGNSGRMKIIGKRLTSKVKAQVYIPRAAG